MRTTSRRVLLAVVGSSVALAVAALVIACGSSYGETDRPAEPGASDAFPEAASPSDALAASDAADADAASAKSLYADAVKRDNPVGYWRLGESAGAAIAKDVSGNHDGVYSTNNTLTFGVAGALANDPDTATTFDGNGHVIVGDFFDFGNNTPFSIELWLKTPATNDAQYRRIISKESALDGYDLEIEPDGNLAFRVFTKGGEGVDGGIFGSIYNPVVAGSYVYVVALYDTTSVQLYVDGVQVRAMTGVVSMKVRNDPFVIGGASFLTPANDARGTIDEVAIYNKVLTPARILAHYIAGHP